MNESTSFNETQPIKQSANYTMFNNPNEEDQSIYPQINSNSTYMKIAIKYKLPPNFSSVFKISKLGNSYGFCPDVNGDSNILIGPHWYFFITFFSLFSLFFYFFNKYFIISSNILILIYIERLFYIMWAITYILTSIKNPRQIWKILEAQNRCLIAINANCGIDRKVRLIIVKNVMYVLKDINIIVYLLDIALEEKIKKNFIFLLCYLYCTDFI